MVRPLINSRKMSAPVTGIHSSFCAMAEKEAGKARIVMNISIDIFLYKRDTGLSLFVIAQNTSLARSPNTHSESSDESKAGFLMYCTSGVMASSLNS